MKQHEEKAKELVERFNLYVNDASSLGELWHQKQCALIAVDFALNIGVSPMDTKELNKIKESIEKM